MVRFMIPGDMIMNLMDQLNAQGVIIFMLNGLIMISFQIGIILLVFLLGILYVKYFDN